MDMNKCFFLRKEDRQPQWHVIDASGKTLGRLCTQIADLLRGRNKPEYTPHTDTGDYVVVTNCTKVEVTGKKFKDKEYVRFSGWRSGLKTRTFEEQMAKDPAEIILHAVRGMLPKNRLSRQIIKKLKVYPGSTHPHQSHVK